MGTRRLIGLPPQSPAPAAERFVLRDVTVLRPGNPAGPLAHQDLTVRDGVITDVSDAEPGAESQLPELRGSRVMPGLVDMHVHLPKASPLGLSAYFGLLFLLHGVTAVRDAGDLDGTAVPAMLTALRGGKPGPRVYYAGAFVTAAPARWPNSHVLSDPADADLAVRLLAVDGATWVKSYENLTVPMIRAVTEAAARHGLQVMGHVPTSLRYEEAMLPDAQHFFGVPEPEDLDEDNVVCRSANWDNVDDTRLEKIVAVAGEHDLANTPTLVQGARLAAGQADYEVARREPTVELLPPFYPDVVWHPTRGLAVYRGLADTTVRQLRTALGRKQQLVAMLHEAGARLHLGTDVQQPFVVPGASLLAEMDLTVQAGVPVEDVWRMATADAGKALGTQQLGTVAVGAPADLLVLDADPATPTALRDQLRAVVSSGRLYHAKALADAVAEFRAWHRHPLVSKVANVFAARQVSHAAARFTH